MKIMEFCSQVLLYNGRTLYIIMYICINVYIRIYLHTYMDIHICVPLSIH